MREERGAITIFLVIIFTALFVLAGLLVDVARIKIAERRVENAVEVAARSALAAYDTNLVGQFGLYGVNLENQSEAVQRYLRLNIEERHEGFTFVDYRIENIYLEALPSQSLLNDELFEKQILEYMKYKAPITVGEKLIEKFTEGSLSKLTKTGTEAVKTSRQGKLVREKATNFNKKLPLDESKTKRLSFEELSALQADLHDISNETVKYKDQLEKSNKSLQELDESTQAKGENTKNSTKLDDKWLKGLERDTDKLSEDITFNKNVQVELARVEAEFNSISINDNSEATIQYRRALSDRQTALLNSLRPLKPLNVPEVKNYPINSTDLKNKLKQIQNLKEYLTASLNDEKIAKLLLTPEDFSLANQVIAPSEAELLEQINDPTAELEKMSGENDIAETSSLALLDLIDSIIQGLKNVATNSGEKIALCEFIMDKYTFATSQTRRGHYFEIGEVEYILCGNNSQILNLTEMFAKVFAVRLGIQIINEIIKSVNPEPISRVCQAIAIGFGKAFKDISNLYDGKPVELIPGIQKPTVSYSDHLRLFLLLQNKKSHFDHMRQLMQVDLARANDKFSLKDHSAIINVEAEVSINLLFSQVLPLDKLNAKFSNGRYTITKEVTVGY